MHGGELRIDSEKGVGTRICLILPVAPEQGASTNLH
jgi:signal transduction histidine kinase